jgi:hypothetical protein
MELNKNDIILNKKNYLPISFNNKDINNMYILFTNVLFDYLRAFKSNIKEKNKKYSLKVIQKGISMLKNVMNILFLYTRNIDLVHKHLNKSFLYYIEFIEQIGEEGNTFLQLSSKDAVLFVYKKTLFEINTDYKKKMEYTKKESEMIDEILENLNLFVFISEYVLFNGAENMDDININYIQKKINKIIDKFKKKQHIENLNRMTSELFNHLIMNELTINSVLVITESFIHKSKNINYTIFKNNLTKTQIKKGINYNKYINSLLVSP